MDNLKLRISLLAIGMMSIAMVLGVFGPNLAHTAMGDALQWWQLVLVGIVFVGLCGVILFNILERALRPIINLTDHFVRLQLGDMAPRLPVEGPEEMQQLARSFNETMSEIELQIRNITEEKQAAERGKQFVVEQLMASQRFKYMADSLSVGLVFTDENLNIVYQNNTSETGMIQLADYVSWDGDELTDISQLFPEEDTDTRLSSPGNLPYETSYGVGPYKIRVQASAVFSEEDEYLGIVVIWEILSLESTKADETLPDLDEGILEEMVEEAGMMDTEVASEDPFELLAENEPGEDAIAFELLAEDKTENEEPFELLPEEKKEVTRMMDQPIKESFAPLHEPEKEANLSNIPPTAHEQALAHGLVNADRQLTRSAALVGRSVRLLSERLSTIMAMVEALCNEGDNLHRSQEETRQRMQNTAYLVTERSESLWELTQEMSGLEDRTRATTVLVKRLKKTLDDTDQITQTMTKLSDAIDHLVIEARLEFARDNQNGLKVIVDEIRKLGTDAAKVNKDVKKRMETLGGEIEDALSLLEEDRREVRSGNRIARRAENALERIEKDLSDVEERTNLLAEMTAGQSEISIHIADQLSELTELINVTQRVASEQARLVFSILADADAHVSSQPDNSFDV